MVFCRKRPCQLCAQRLILKRHAWIVSHLREHPDCRTNEAIALVLRDAGWSAGLVLMMDDLGAPLVQTVVTHG